MKIRYLHIEDSKQDSLLIQRSLRSDGWEVDAKIVDTVMDFRKALTEPWDAILADFSVPGLPTEEALQIAKADFPDLPFIVVSGKIGEENAVSLMKAGVDDYASKDHPNRLTPILHRLLNRARLREEHRVRELKNRELEVQYQHFFHKNLAGMAIVGLDGNIDEINQAMLDILKLDRDRLPGFWDLFLEPGWVRSGLSKLRQEGAFGPNLVELRRTDGESVFGMVTCQLNPTGSGIWINLIDHSENQRLQQQMLELQKRETLGQLAGGIAHEFNNILTIILGQLTLIELQFPEGNPALKRLATVEEAANRGAAVVRQLLLLARNRRIYLTLFPVRDLLEDTVRMVSGLMPENLQMQTDVPEGLALMFGDRDLLGQALLNLLINARDAMPDGGLIVLRARQEEEHIRLEVEDDGRGVPREIQSKIFDPYFSTKDVGRGTGMGLPMVRSVAELHQGSCGFDLRIPNGSVFYLRIPNAAPPSEQISEIDEAAPPSSSPGSESMSVLLVENEWAILEFETEALKRLGYQVHSEVSAEAAWDHLRARQGTYDLVITDLGMAGGGGAGLIEKVQTLTPRPRVLVQTGNPFQGSEDWIKSAWVEGFLYKPFTIPELKASIEVAMEKKA